MTTAAIPSTRPRSAVEAHRQLLARQREQNGDIPSFAQDNARTWAITENGIGQAGEINRFVSGVFNSANLGEATTALTSAVQDFGSVDFIKVNGIAGAIEGAFSGGLRGAIEGGVTGALNAAIAQSGIADQLNNMASQLGVQLPAVPGIPALGGASPSGASGGAAAAGRAGVTRSGTLATTTPAPARTNIQDPTQENVDITVDSFLQGLQGSLSSLAQGIGGILGGAIQELLGSTALSGALGGLVSGLSQGLSNALGGLSNALGQAASGLLSGLGNAIQSIPGVGPALSGMTNAIGDFAGNLSGAYNNLPPLAKAGVDGAIAAVGANVINRVGIPGVPRIPPAAAGIATAAISFSDNPSAQLRQIAERAKEVHQKTYSETRDPTFSNIASTASRAAREMEGNIQRNAEGNFVLIRDPDQAQADVNNTKVIENNAITPPANTFEDTLNDVQLQSFRTYERIIDGKFAVYGSTGQILANLTYREYVEFEKLVTPETRNFIVQISAAEAQTIQDLANRFLTFYRSSKSRYTMDGL